MASCSSHCLTSMEHCYRIEMNYMVLANDVDCISDTGVPISTGVLDTNEQELESLI